jgi:tetratricopeptide (TPR) repeat protein
VPAAAAVVPAALAPQRPPRDFAEARQLILEGQYEAGIKAMQTLGFDDRPDGAAYVGLAHRRLGRIAEAQAWYERALRGNPGHLLTLSFDGMLRAEQGDLARARENLEKIRQLCGGTTCTEYRALEVVLAGAAR